MAYRPGLARRARRFVFAHATAAYLGAIGVLTALLLGLGFAYAQQHGDSPWPLAWVALLLLLPASDVAIAVVQRLALASPLHGGCRASTSWAACPRTRGRWSSCRRC